MFYLQWCSTLVLWIQLMFFNVVHSMSWLPWQGNGLYLCLYVLLILVITGLTPLGLRLLIDVHMRTFMWDYLVSLKTFVMLFSAFFVIEHCCICVCCFQMSVDNIKKSACSSNSGNLVYWSSSFPRQPARVLIVEALPPWWSETCAVLCDALDNFLSLACCLDGPCRIPLLSLYAISRQQECLLPFVVRKMKEKYFVDLLLVCHVLPLTPLHFIAFCQYQRSLTCIPYFSLSTSIFSRFVLTWPGCVPASRSWGLFQVKVVSEEQPGEASCCDRRCWTVCNSLNSTSDIPVQETRPAITHLWRWVEIDPLYAQPAQQMYLSKCEDLTAPAVFVGVLLVTLWVLMAVP